MTLTCCAVDCSLWAFSVELCCCLLCCRVFDSLKGTSVPAVDFAADIRRMYDSVKTTFYEAFLDACGEKMLLVLGHRDEKQSL